MPERTLLRIGSISAILGAILGFTVNAVYPRTFQAGVTEESLTLMAESPIWEGVHIGIMFTGLLILSGMVALYRSISQEPGAGLARLGYTTAVVGGCIFLVSVAIDGFAMKAVAESWISASEAQKAVAFQVAYAVGQVNFGIYSIWFIIFFGVTLILYGLAIGLSDVYPHWLGWAAVAGGLWSATVGLIQFYNGPSVLNTDLRFLLLMFLISIWVLVMGVFLWRKAGAAA